MEKPTTTEAKTDIHKMMMGLALPDVDLIASEIGFSVEHYPYHALAFKTTDMAISNSSSEILECACSNLPDFGQGSAFSSGDSAIICYLSTASQDNRELVVKDFAFQMIETMRKQPGIALSCGISLECHGADEFREAFLQADSALARSFYTGVYSINTFSGLNIERDRRDAARLKALIQDDLAKANPNDPTQLISILDELKDYAYSTDLRKEYIISLYLDVIYSAFSKADASKTPDYVRAEWLTLSLPTVQTLNQLHKTAVNILSSLCNVQIIPGNETNVIRQIKDYVSDNIATQLSLNDIATHVYMNPTYLSQMFKQKTGENLRAFITSERIKKAKKLLSQEKTIHETALLTGFMSDSYFIQCFKDATGLTPREFVRNHRLDCC